MADRREFLRGGAALSTLPLAAGSLPSTTAEAAATVPIPLYKVIYDRRFPESLAFGLEAERLGANVHGFDGDVTPLWYDDLYGRWKEGPAAVAGLTAQGALFVLERWAWEAGMRVVFRADHRRGTEGAVEHILSAPPSGDWLAGHFDEAGPDFALEAARIVTRWPRGRFQVTAAPGVSFEENEPEPLVSWVIAPVLEA